jgi:hypothetical protein
VAVLLVIGVGLALLGMLIVDVTVPESAVEAGSRVGPWAGAVLSLAGYALTLAGLVRWSLRTRRDTSTTAAGSTSAASAAV